MKLTAIAIVLAALFAAAGCSGEQKGTADDKDLKAIERLHQKGIAASKAGDFETLRSLMTDDAVIMPPGVKFVRGRAEVDANFDQAKNVMSEIEMLDYAMDFEEVKILGDYAYEWGTIRGSMRAKESDEAERSNFKVMRILKKQPDGEWKVYRSIWNDNADEPNQR